MSNQQGISHIHEHVQSLPQGWSQVPEQKVMARRRHEKKNHKSEKAQLLKREIREASEILIRSQQADERIFIPETVELPDCGRTVDRSQNKSDYTEVPAIIKQWQERRVQPTERSNAEDDMEKQECGGSRPADNQS